MSYREITMQQIEEILRRKHAGQSARRIARETGLNRKTVKRYVDEALAHGVEGPTATEAEVAWVGRQVQERPTPTPSTVWQEPLEHRQQIEAWLQMDKPLRLVRVRELLQREGVNAGYSTLRRFVRREFGWRKQQPTVLLLDRPPAEEAQIDFGLMGRTTDEDGQQRKLHALIVTLSYSRYQFVWPTRTQTADRKYKRGALALTIPCAARLMPDKLRRCYVNFLLPDPPPTAGRSRPLQRRGHDRLLK